MDEEIRRKILTIMDQHRIMTIATRRPDGWPQAATVGHERRSKPVCNFSFRVIITTAARATGKRQTRAQRER